MFSINFHDLETHLEVATDTPCELDSCWTEFGVDNIHCLQWAEDWQHKHGYMGINIQLHHDHGGAQASDHEQPGICSIPISASIT